MQALLAPTVFPQPRRTASGVDFQRLILVAAVMGKQPGFSLGAQDIIVNITGGLRIVEPAADLGMAVAMASSLRNSPCQPRTVVIGEVGLGGEVRPVFGLERRLSEAAKLGFKQAIIPEAQARDAEGSAILCIPVSTVRQAVTTALISGHKQDQQKRNTPNLEKEAV